MVSFIMFALLEWIFRLFLIKKTAITWEKLALLEKNLNLF